ncbi:hypothetical protein ACFW3D_36905 [Streptomyces sp. NPDC058864]
MSLPLPPLRFHITYGAPSTGPSHEVYVPPADPRDDGLSELLFTAETVAICVVAALLVVFLMTDRRAPRRRARHRR